MQYIFELLRYFVILSEAKDLNIKQIHHLNEILHFVQNDKDAGNFMIPTAHFQCYKAGA